MRKEDSWHKPKRSSRIRRRLHGDWGRHVARIPDVLVSGAAMTVIPKQITDYASLEAERKPPKAAEDVLAKYITSKYQPSRRTRDIEDIDIADALAIYHAHREGIYLERKGQQIDITEFAARIGRLNDFFGGMMLVEVNARSCAKYVKARGRRGGARRDLEDLRAAINHPSREGLHRGLVRVALPAKGRGRDRWLTRSEAAALLWGLLAISRSANTPSRRSEKSKN